MTDTDPIRVMLVDDSAVVRGLMTRALQDEKSIEIVATATTGVMALSTIKQQKIDVVILDIEMPEMDGLTALPQLIALSPATKVVMASSLTSKGAEISLRALSLGASDYISKPSSRDPEAVQNFYRELIDKVKALGRSKFSEISQVTSSGLLVEPQVRKFSLPSRGAPHADVRAIAIACSTGGPQALLAVFAALKGKSLSVPVFITQHMPATFTTILAEHIAKTSGHPCAEAKEGEEIQAGRIYLAPGDYHLIAEKNDRPVLHITKDAPVNYCRPAADPMIASLSAIYGKHLLVAVLTGMGHDGLEGARVAAAAGAIVIAQDEASSVVWGMPRAVAEQSFCRAILPLAEVAPYLLRALERAGP